MSSCAGALDVTGVQQVSTAAALLVGSELLSGKVEERNLAPLARALRALGIQLERTVMVPDAVERIAAEVRALSSAYDVVITSGGVGPTHDDVTMEAVARAFDVPVVRHPELVELLGRVYGDRCGETHLRMARVPAGAGLRHCSEVRWPTVVMHNVWVFPGIPELFRTKLLTLRAHLAGPETRHSLGLLIQLEETAITDRIDTVVAQFPAVEVGSYPKWFDPSHKTKVTFDAADRTSAESARDALAALLPPGTHRPADE